MCVFVQPLHEQNVTQGQLLVQLPSLKSIATQIKSPVRLHYLTLVGMENSWIHAFPKSIKAH